MFWTSWMKEKASHWPVLRTTLSWLLYVPMPEYLKQPCITTNSNMKMPMKVKGIKYFVMWELLCQVELYPVFRHTFHLLVMKRTSFLKLINFQIFKEYEIYEIFFIYHCSHSQGNHGKSGNFYCGLRKNICFPNKIREMHVYLLH